MIARLPSFEKTPSASLPVRIGDHGPIAPIQRRVQEFPDHRALAGPGDPDELEV
jgi:hypothetical protein